MDKVDEHFSDKIVWLSFVMSILVMYIHADNLNNTGFANTMQSLNYQVTLFFSKAIGEIAVPFFFMMSGYWYFRFNIFEDSAICTIFFKLKKRLLSLVIPYLLWNTLGMLFYMCVTRISFISKAMNSSEIITITAENILKGIFFHAYYFPFWYLQDLLILIALTPIFLFVLRKRRIVEGVIAFTLLLCCTSFTALPPPVHLCFIFCLGATSQCIIKNYLKSSTQRMNV